MFELLLLAITVPLQIFAIAAIAVELRVQTSQPESQQQQPQGAASTRIDCYSKGPKDLHSQSRAEVDRAHEIYLSEFVTQALPFKIQISP